jgi:hypothetical protein
VSEELIRGIAGQHGGNNNRKTMDEVSEPKVECGPGSVEWSGV